MYFTLHSFLMELEITEMQMPQSRDGVMLRDYLTRR